MKSPIIMRVFVIFTLCRLLVEAEPSAKFLKEYKKLESFVIDTLTEEQAQAYHDCTKNGVNDRATFKPSCTRTMFKFFNTPRKHCHSELFKSVYNVESWEKMTVPCTDDHVFRGFNDHYSNLANLALRKFSTDPALNAQFDTFSAEFDTFRAEFETLLTAMNSIRLALNSIRLALNSRLRSLSRRHQSRSRGCLLLLRLR
eukprot:894167_1